MPLLDPNISTRDQWAKEHSTRGLKELLNKKIARDSGPTIPGRSTPFPPEIPLPTPPVLNPDSKQITDAKVAIVGAGAAGLFTAMILDYLNIALKDCGFNVSYDIFEVADKDRVGGRLFTYNFIPQGTKNPSGKHDYYDVGAMRFPENKVMTRLFDLFVNLNMKKSELSENPRLGSLIPYYIQNLDDNGVVLEPWRFNNINKWGGYSKIVEKAQNSDPFNLNGDAADGTHKIPVSILKQSPDDTINKTVQDLRDALKQDLKTSPPGTTGWDLLMSYDIYSTRQFLAVSQQKDASNPDSTLPPFNYETIEFLETFNGGTSWYDQAHSETVLESLDFDYSDDSSDNKWWAVLGGSQQLALKMQESLTTKPTYLSRVTAVRVGDIADMEVDIQAACDPVDAPLETRQYNGVFNTTTLGCLKRIDTTQTNLNYSTLQAIRSLGYGPSAKVGVKFKRAWWIHDLDDKYKIKKGGLGHSDLNIRTCVYPSYNIDDPKDEPAVLLCSYTWQQDAERMGALMSGSTAHDQQLKDEALLKELLLRDLARLHTYDGTTEDKMYDLISGLYLDHHAHDWTHDPNTAGAFAFFRPQQFSNVWNKLIHPSGNFIVIGEAASPHHAWVVGALESAVHGLHFWLSLRQTDIKGAAQAMRALEKAVDGNPFVGLPPYVDEIISGWSAINARAELEDYKKAQEGKSILKGLSKMTSH